MKILIKKTWSLFPHRNISTFVKTSPSSQKPLGPCTTVGELSMVYGVRVLLLDPLQILDFNRLCHNDPMGGKQLVAFSAVNLKFLQDPMGFLNKKNKHQQHQKSTTPQLNHLNLRLGIFHGDSFMGFSPFSIHLIFIEPLELGTWQHSELKDLAARWYVRWYTPVRLDPFRDEIHHAKSPPFRFF